MTCTILLYILENTHLQQHTHTHLEGLIILQETWSPYIRYIYTGDSSAATFRQWVYKVHHTVAVSEHHKTWKAQWPPEELTALTTTMSPIWRKLDTARYETGTKCCCFFVFCTYTHFSSFLLFFKRLTDPSEGWWQHDFVLVAQWRHEDVWVRGPGRYKPLRLSRKATNRPVS